MRIEALEVAPGDKVLVRFVQVGSEWRQGVWIATEGLLAVAGQQLPQVVLWSDSAPREVELVVHQTDGLLRVHNVWDSGRGIAPYESHSATSGMLASAIGEHQYRFSCNDIGLSGRFSKLVFEVELPDAPRAIEA